MLLTLSQHDEVGYNKAYRKTDEGWLRVAVLRLLFKGGGSGSWRRLPGVVLYMSCYIVLCVIIESLVK